MDISTINILTEMGVKLTSLALKGTATAIHSKIGSVKTEKDVATLRNTYDEIVNQLLSEREEAIRIAQAYKEEFDKVEISDSDIEHLHCTVTSVLQIFKAVSPHTESIESYGKLNELISVDTLKTMQLLGFNYKAAIGEPLTKLCAEAISSFTKKNSFKKN